MRIWIDTEFNGFGGELISMALVAEDGEEFYEVVTFNETVDPWVDQNVIPILEKSPISMFMFQHLLENFLCRYDEVHVIADWVEDVSHLCMATIIGPGLRINLPKELTIEVCSWLEAESKVPHNALWDARANMEMWLEEKIYHNSNSSKEK